LSGSHFKPPALPEVCDSELAENTANLKIQFPDIYWGALKFFVGVASIKSNLHCQAYANDALDRYDLATVAAEDETLATDSVFSEAILKTRDFRSVQDWGAPLISDRNTHADDMHGLAMDGLFAILSKRYMVPRDDLELALEYCLSPGEECPK
jgi:hypothetical protein